MTYIQNRNSHNKTRFQNLCIFRIRGLYIYKNYNQKNSSIRGPYQLHQISIYFFNISFHWSCYFSFSFVNLLFFICHDVSLCLFEGNIKFSFKFCISRFSIRCHDFFVLSCKICPMYGGNNDAFLSFFPFALLKLTTKRASNSLYLDFFKHPLQFRSVCLRFSLKFKLVHV